MVVELLGAIIGGGIALGGLIFRNEIMQLVGGAILIYALGIWHILPTWMIVLLVILFIYLIVKKK